VSGSALVIVTWAGAAEGSEAAAAAVACGGPDPERANLLVELGAGPDARPSLVASVAARRLEERLAAHLPDVPAVSCGRLCRVALPADTDGLARVPAALALARDSVVVVHLHPAQLRAALAARLDASSVLLRVDLRRDRALAGLAARGLMASGLRVSVLKRPLNWVAARRARLGLLPAGASGGLPARVLERCLAPPRGSVEDDVALADDLST
jgi:hypothetical protein